VIDMVSGKPTFPLDVQVSRDQSYVANFESKCVTSQQTSLHDILHDFSLIESAKFFCRLCFFRHFLSSTNSFLNVRRKFGLINCK
jgi:hypothetical protein